MAARRGVYQRMTDKQLQKLRSKKYLELTRLDKRNSFFSTADKKRLIEQIFAIDIELDYRLHRMPLL